MNHDYLSVPEERPAMKRLKTDHQKECDNIMSSTDRYDAKGEGTPQNNVDREVQVGPVKELATGFVDKANELIKTYNDLTGKTSSAQLKDIWALLDDNAEIDSQTESVSPSSDVADRKMIHINYQCDTCNSTTSSSTAQSPSFRDIVMELSELPTSLSHLTNLAAKYYTNHNSQTNHIPVETDPRLLEYDVFRITGTWEECNDYQKLRDWVEARAQAGEGSSIGIRVIQLYRPRNEIKFTLTWCSTRSVGDAWVNNNASIIRVADIRPLIIPEKYLKVLLHNENLGRECKRYLIGEMQKFDSFGPFKYKDPKQIQLEFYWNNPAEGGSAHTRLQGKNSWTKWTTKTLAAQFQATGGMGYLEVTAYPSQENTKQEKAAKRSKKGWRQ
ncbi:hypothetical protein PMZ80_006233 [Knufia obscura]|uniref:Uncharacterized protein n=1 Tax=Knufia obscura TaxID=1635080 RepID=A0ABR0RK34_9EURO|nr:hypothetical protein PMZ80_006233 [Knufia obscura]